jgi:hypothetical protein
MFLTPVTGTRLPCLYLLFDNVLKTIRVAMALKTSLNGALHVDDATERQPHREAIALPRLQSKQDAQPVASQMLRSAALMPSPESMLQLLAVLMPAQAILAVPLLAT